jgi:hypothetical protein
MGTVDEAAAAANMYIEEMLSQYEKNTNNLSPDKRMDCMGIVRREADRLRGEIKSLREIGVSGVHLEKAAARGIDRINSIVKPYFPNDETSGKMASLDASLQDLHLVRPHHKEGEEGVGTLFGKYFQGELGHTIMHKVNKPIGLAAETVAGTLLNRGSKPTGDKVAEAAVDVGLVAGVDHVITTVAAEEAMIVTAELEGAFIASKFGKVPAFKILLGVEVAGYAAGLGEKVIKNYSDKHFSPDEHVGPCMDEGGCLNPYQSAYATQKILQGVQVPAKTLHAIPHVILERSKKALNAVGLTAENIGAAAASFNKYVGEHPPVPEVFP